MLMPAILAASALWIPIGVSESRLRVFVDARSVRDVAGYRRATIRIGAPDRITGKVVLVYQHEELDCPGRRWRLLSYDARDENDRVVRRTVPPKLPPAFLPVRADTLGAAVSAKVCALQPVFTAKS